MRNYQNETTAIFVIVSKVILLSCPKYIRVLLMVVILYLSHS